MIYKLTGIFGCVHVFSFCCLKPSPSQGFKKMFVYIVKNQVVLANKSEFYVPGTGMHLFSLQLIQANLNHISSSIVVMSRHLYS